MPRNLRYRGAGWPPDTEPRTAGGGDVVVVMAITVLRFRFRSAAEQAVPTAGERLHLIVRNLDVGHVDDVFLADCSDELLVGVPTFGGLDSVTVRSESALGDGALTFLREDEVG